MTITILIKQKKLFTKVVDIIISIINNPVKQKFQINIYDCDFIIIIQLIAFFAPKKKIEFIRLIKKYYSFRYENFDFIIIYLIQIKILEERIRGINVIFNDNKQILLCLNITLSKYFQYYIKIWTITLEITANKTRFFFF